MVTLASSTQRGTANKDREQTVPWSDSAVNGFPIENALRDLQFKLANNLQCSLDLNTTLELFFSNIQEAVTVHGMRYSPPEGPSHSLGKSRAHRVSYNINSGELRLGSIEFNRSKRFLEKELAALEALIGVLFFPLRNALLYQQALANSLRDTLTGIGNRSALESSFAREIKLAQRHQHALSLLVLDVDHFKKINDEFGHQCGDTVLRKIAQTIQGCLRETDQVFRYGGEEFVVLLHNTGLSDAKLTAERIRITVAMSPTQVEEREIIVNISIGASALHADDSLETFFARADRALYRAKRLGRNKVVTSDANDV